mmetsp:Transcript_71290/g.118485  ORF Transcript_71290/g.118485 Transcript_71290/m.118485 type:complete len:374 (+) Transcript_71290:87-1208(+)
MESEDGMDDSFIIQGEETEVTSPFTPPGAHDFLIAAVKTDEMSRDEQLKKRCHVALTNHIVMETLYRRGTLASASEQAQVAQTLNIAGAEVKAWVHDQKDKDQKVMPMKRSYSDYAFLRATFPEAVAQGVLVGVNGSDAIAKINLQCEGLGAADKNDKVQVVSSRNDGHSAQFDWQEKTTEQERPPKQARTSPLDPNVLEHIREINTELEQSRAAESFVQMITTATEPFTVVYVSEAWRQLYECSSSAEVVGRTLKVLYGPQTDSIMLAHEKQVQREQPPLSSRLLLYTKAGLGFVSSVHVKPLINRKGVLTFFQHVYSEIDCAPGQGVAALPYLEGSGTVHTVGSMQEISMPDSKRMDKLDFADIIDLINIV